MKKMAVFNVGGALSVYLNINGVRIMYDIGKSETFNPVVDFLLPLARKNNWENDDGKYMMDQLIISHPHADHISAIEDFERYFFPHLLTCQNDKTKDAEGKDVSKKEILDYSQFDSDLNAVKCLRRMYENRSLPLVPRLGEGGGDKQLLFWLKPGEVADDDDLISNGECYANNVSLVNLFEINGYWVLLPGDLMKNGMSRLLYRAPQLYKKLSSHGLDILIAPHHGLESAFSAGLFQAMKDGKTRCLNIIPEKQDSNNENRNVDTRYYSSEYCEGRNNLEGTNVDGLSYGRKTSNGHICIDFETSQNPSFKIVKDNDELIAFFSE